MSAKTTNLRTEPIRVGGHVYGGTWALVPGRRRAIEAAMGAVRAT